jgi:sortase (surface protein transpeptidase)
MWRDWRVYLAAGVVLAVAGGAFALLAPRSHQPPSLPRTASSAAPSASPLAVPQAAMALPRSVPVSLSIPAIGVNNATVVPEGTTNGALDVPPLTGPQAYDVGWWDGGNTPGQDGPAVLVSHVNSAAMGNLTFANLDEMKAGEEAEVTLADGTKVWFTVAGTQEVGKTAFPTQAVYGPTSGPTLRLITCGGPFDSATGHYVDNFIVYLNESVPSG